MFSFKANIIKRRKISVTALFIGIVGAALAGYLLPLYLKDGLIPVVEQFVRQIGLIPYTGWFYAGIFLLLGLAIIPAIKTVFQKKLRTNGYVAFDENSLKIIKGKQRFLIPQSELGRLDFEIPNLEEKKSTGGSFMKIPTQKGIFVCELDLDSPEHKKELLNMIKFLKIEHEVEVGVKEI